MDKQGSGDAAVKITDADCLLDVGTGPDCAKLGQQ